MFSILNFDSRLRLTDTKHASLSLSPQSSWSCFKMDQSRVCLVLKQHHTEAPQNHDGNYIRSMRIRTQHDPFRERERVARLSPFHHSHDSLMFWWSVQSPFSFLASSFTNRIHFVLLPSFRYSFLKERRPPHLLMSGEIEWWGEKRRFTWCNEFKLP